MRRFKFVALCVLVAFFALTTAPVNAKAEEYRMKTIFMDTFYGMAAGALIATALSLTQDKPDWGENVGTGAAIGGIAGALFGVATEARYLASVEDGQVHVSLPSVNVSISGNRDSAIYTAGLFQYRF